MKFYCLSLFQFLLKLFKFLKLELINFTIFWVILFNSTEINLTNNLIYNQGQQIILRDKGGASLNRFYACLMSAARQFSLIDMSQLSVNMHPLVSCWMLSNLFQFYCIPNQKKKSYYFLLINDIILISLTLMDYSQDSLELTKFYCLKMLATMSVPFLQLMKHSIQGL